MTVVVGVENGLQCFASSLMSETITVCPYATCKQPRCRHTQKQRTERSWGENSLILAGEELFWEARILLPVAGRFLYKYIVVDEVDAVVAGELEPRLMDVSDKLRERSVIQIRDTWQASYSFALLKHTRGRLA